VSRSIAIALLPVGGSDSFRLYVAKMLRDEDIDLLLKHLKEAQGAARRLNLTLVVALLSIATVEIARALRVDG
jgi:CHASE3 domain sensor protein